MITIAFTIVAAIALIVLVGRTREHYLDRVAVKRAREDGAALEAATFFVVVLGGITLADLLLLVAGVGALVQFRPVVWGLVFIPIVFLVVALWIWRIRSRTLELVALRKEKERH